MPRKTDTERKAPAAKYGPGDIVRAVRGAVCVVVQLNGVHGSRYRYEICKISGRRPSFWDYETHLRPMAWTFHGPVEVHE